MNALIKYLCVAAVFILLNSCVKDKPQAPVTTSANLNSTNKVFVINEGNFGNVPGNSSISLYDAISNTVVEDFYKQQNATSILGDVSQSMTKYNNNYYIIVNNSHKIEVVSAYDFKKTTTITGFNSPRYLLPITYNKAYVSDLFAHSIQIVDLNSNTINGSIPTYSNTEEMVLVYNKVFVTSPYSNYCYVINSVTDLVTDSITIGKGVSSILVDKNSKVWVLSSGNSAASQVGKLARINPVTLQVELSLSFTSTDSPIQLCTNKTRDTLYYLNSGVCQFPITNAVLPIVPLIDDVNQSTTKAYYGLGINPIDYSIYVSDAIDYVQKSTIEVYAVNGSFKTSFKAGFISNGFMFE